MFRRQPWFWPNDSRVSIESRRLILAARTRIFARQDSGRLGTATSAIQSTHRSPKPMPSSIWRAISNQRSPQRCAAARFWRPSQKDGSRPSWISPSISVPGGCKLRRCGGESISEIGRALRKNYADGSMAAEKCCRDWFCGGRLRPICWASDKFRKPNPFRMSQSHAAIHAHISCNDNRLRLPRPSSTTPFCYR